MRKPRSNSHLARLDRAQLDSVEAWLFEQRQGYSVVCNRIKAEFGQDISIHSLSRFYKSRSRERQMTDLVAAQAFSDTVGGVKLNMSSLRSAAIKLIAKTTLDLACEKPDELKDLGALAKVLLSSEDNEIRRGHLELERDRFRHKSTGDLSEEIPKLARLLVTIEEDDSLNDDQKIEKVHALLFPASSQNGNRSSGEMNQTEAA